MADNKFIIRNEMKYFFKYDDVYILKVYRTCSYVNLEKKFYLCWHDLYLTAFTRQDIFNILFRILLENCLYCRGKYIKKFLLKYKGGSSNQTKRSHLAGTMVDFL